MHIFMANSRASKSLLMTELCFHCFVNFGCVSIYIFSFHHKKCASEWDDFTIVMFTAQIFCSANESLTIQGKTLFYSSFPYENGCLPAFDLFHMFHNQLSLYILLSYIKGYRCLKKVIHQIDSFNEW